ncbi:hypothetical protein NEDG_00863 [Nematocida displodere]|uniref:tRNA-binding domain-containing protein n=1 Tax=Nematocida displodere TaxID=1805483 RepID=A0A177EE86_9MICR|nr:hypothetical protein NEDG_00863 [Nematocida displodere]
MDPEKKEWLLKLSVEHSYLYVLKKIFSDVNITITDENETILTDPEGKAIKGPGKAMSCLLQSKGVESGVIKRITDVVGLRPQQMIGYSTEEHPENPETPENPSKTPNLDSVIAVAKLRKWVFEGQITNKTAESIIDKLSDVYAKYQHIYCAQTKECSVPREKIKSVCDFYKVMVHSGQIESIIDHPEADTLYIENVDFSHEKRTIVSGLKYKVEKDCLLNRSCLFVLNLKPATIKGTKSFGMILFATPNTPNTPGTVIFTETNGQRLILRDYPISELVPFTIAATDCSKKTTETFFTTVSIASEKLLYDGMATSLGGREVTIPGISSGRLS